MKIEGGHRLAVFLSNKEMLKMISMKNLTAKDLNSIAKQLHQKGNETETVAVLVETTEYVKGEGEKIINQAIIPCKEVQF